MRRVPLAITCRLRCGWASGPCARRCAAGIGRRPTAWTPLLRFRGTLPSGSRGCTRRPAEVIYPPVQTDRFRQRAPAPGRYWLVVSRFEAYKRVDLAIAAANALQEELVIVGAGGDEPRLRRLAGPTVRFLGYQSEAAVAELLAGCRALLFPGEEDFGLTPLEANAAGKPVIAYGAGGALETVVPGVTGSFFTEPTAPALAEVMTAFDPAQFDPAVCRRQADRFAPATFRERLQVHVERVMAAPPDALA